MAILDDSVLNDLRELDPDGSGGFLKQIVGVFEEQTVEILEALRAAATANDLVTLGNLAHKLKGSSRTVGAAELGNLCESLERDARQGEMPDASERLDGLVEACSRARTALNEQINERE